MTDVRYREYAPGDRGASLRLFDGNTPRYFNPAERPQFERFLRFFERRAESRHRRGFFGVLDTADGNVVGCGGLLRDRENPRLAILRWGIVAQERHGEGFGRPLLMARRRRMLEVMPDVQEVILFTSGEVAGFYRHLGFVELGTEPDHYGPGLDQVRFRRNVDPNFRATILGGA